MTPDEKPATSIPSSTTSLGDFAMLATLAGVIALVLAVAAAAALVPAARAAFMQPMRTLRED